MELLVVGGSGFLGAEITRQAQHAGHRVVATFHSSAPPTEPRASATEPRASATEPRPSATEPRASATEPCTPSRPRTEWHRLDIRRRDDVIAVARRAQPDVVLNAAYRQADWVTTADGAAHVAMAAAAVGARLVHVSSDVVFSGAATRYDETQPPDPITPYGAAKAAAETAVAAIVPAAVVARTSLILGDGGSPQERFVHAVASDAVSGALFTDDVRCPVHVADLASALLELAASPHAGVHHVAGPDAVSRYELGELIALRDGIDRSALRAGRRALSRVPGPLQVRLDCTWTQKRLTTHLRGAREFLAPA